MFLRKLLALIESYCFEFFQDSVRSAVNTVLQLFTSTGVLLAYCVGPYISYLQLIIVSVAPCALFIIFYPWLRESPYYLVYKNDTRKAISNLHWLRGGVSQSCIEQEIKQIQASSYSNHNNDCTKFF